LWLVRGDPDRAPGPVRTILLYTVFMGVPFGFGEYRSLVRQGRGSAWWVIPLYLAAGTLAGCFMSFMGRRKPRKPAGDFDASFRDSGPDQLEPPLQSSVTPRTAFTPSQEGLGSGDTIDNSRR